MQQMKKKLPCVYISTAPLLSHHLLQSWGSLGCPFSFYIPLSRALVFLKNEFSVRHHWANSRLCEAKWIKRGETPAFHMTFLASKAKLGDPVICENSLTSRKPLCPRRRMAAKSSKERGGTEALRLGSRVWQWVSHYTPVSSHPGLRRRQRMKRCPDDLSCALGPNSVSQ